jgi:hypothetical protein
MKKPKTPEPVVYCGPDIPRVAHSFTSYAEIPEQLRETGVKCPAIFALIVPLSHMAATRRALKTPGSREAILYGRIQKFIQGGI